jgi:hypothetical protein
MAFLFSLVSFVLDAVSLLWVSLVRQLAPPPPRRTPGEPRPPPAKLDAIPDRHLSNDAERGMVSLEPAPPSNMDPREDFVSDSSFLSQLEQRTQQVKITLANLEAEKIRIEGLITQLQPLVPHYDALLEAERSISEAQIPLEAAAPPVQQNPWEQHREESAPRW